MKKQIIAPEIEMSLIQDISILIEHANRHVMREVDTTRVTLYWAIGRRINQDVLEADRAKYGQQVLENLAEHLTVKYGKGYGHRNLRRMVKFARYFSDEKILSSLMTKLTWTHFIHLLSIEAPLKRDFYAEMSRIESWGTRELYKKIQGMFYERIGLAKKPTAIIESELKKLRETSEVTTDVVIQDPLIFEHFEGMDFPTEGTLEQAILDDIEKFLLSLGNGFAFLERQKVVEIDNNFHRIDLLMYHRRLRCLVVIELKLGHFKAQDKGQIELYLRWLEKYEMQPGESPPIGIILCSEKSDETVELLQLNQNGIHVSQFLTELPPKELLIAKLHAAIERAKAGAETREAIKNLDDMVGENNE